MAEGDKAEQVHDQMQDDQLEPPRRGCGRRLGAGLTGHRNEHNDAAALLLVHSVQPYLSKYERRLGAQRYSNIVFEYCIRV